MSRSIGLGWVEPVEKEEVMQGMYAVTAPTSRLDIVVAVVRDGADAHADADDGVDADADTGADA